MGNRLSSGRGIGIRGFFDDGVVMGSPYHHMYVGRLVTA